MKGLSGVFIITDTIGFPLECILLECRDRGVVVAWDEFIHDARTHGWTDKTIHRKAIGAVSEVHNSEYVAEFTKKLNFALA